MTIRFSPERRQPPPHYRHGPRATSTSTAREAVRAIVHPDAIRIARPREPLPLATTEPVSPHAIVFAHKRPPPGTATVTSAAPRTNVRAILHPDARLPRNARAPAAPTTTEPIAPHRIAFAASVPAPRYR